MQSGKDRKNGYEKQVYKKPGRGSEKSLEKSLDRTEKNKLPDYKIGLA